jgi:hypothetical protein
VDGEAGATTPDEPGKISAEVNSAKLKQLLNKIKTA